MFNFLRTIKRIKNKNDKIYGKNFKKDKNGKFIVDIKSESLDDFIGEYSICGNKHLIPDIYESIEKIAYNLPLNASGIEFVFEYQKSEGKEKDDMIKQGLVKGFKHHYTMKSLIIEREKKNNFIVSFLCLGLAIFFFIILGLIEIFIYDKVPEAVWEIIVVIGWVFGWEAVDRLCFRIPEFNFEQIKNYRLYKSDVKFKNVKNLQSPKVENGMDDEFLVRAFEKMEEKDNKILSKLQEKK